MTINMREAYNAALLADAVYVNFFENSNAIGDDWRPSHATLRCLSK